MRTLSNGKGTGVKGCNVENEEAHRWAQAIGQNFRAARLEAGLSAANGEFAQRIASFFLWTVEHGRANLSLESIVFLAEVVGEDITRLMKTATGKGKRDSGELRRSRTA